MTFHVIMNPFWYWSYVAFLTPDKLNHSNANIDPCLSFLVSVIRKYGLIAINPAPRSKYLIKLWSVCHSSYDGKSLYWLWAKCSIWQYSVGRQSTCKPKRKWSNPRHKLSRCSGYHSWWHLFRMEFPTQNRTVWQCPENISWECQWSKRPTEGGCKSRGHAGVSWSHVLRLHRTLDQRANDQELHGAFMAYACSNFK